MSIYRLKGLKVWSVFKVTTLISTVFGGVCGVLLGALEGDLIGILGGLFLGFMFALASGITYALYAWLFNILAPSLGGIEIQLEKADPFLDSLEQPIPLVSHTDAVSEAKSLDTK